MEEVDQKDFRIAALEAEQQATMESMHNVFSMPLMPEKQ
jgi:hypothetical protein